MSELAGGGGLQDGSSDDFTPGQDRFHTVTLEQRGESWLDNPQADGGLTASISCPGDHPGNSCDQCRESRTPAFDDASWDSASPMRQIHGEWHVWSTDCVWALPYAGCLVAEGDYWESALGIMDAHGAGTYLVDVEWEDGDPWLIAITEDGSPLPAGDATHQDR